MHGGMEGNQIHDVSTDPDEDATVDRVVVSCHRFCDVQRPGVTVIQSGTAENFS